MFLNITIGWIEGEKGKLDVYIGLVVAYILIVVYLIYLKCSQPTIVEALEGN